MYNSNNFSGSIPANYDKYLGPFLFEPYALDLKERLKNDLCTMVLELACGTGRVTNHLTEILDKNGKIIATDINGDMIAVAKTKVMDARIDWQVVDAQELPFNEALFDHVICQFGVMFFPDKLKAFKEAYRVLSKGGKFVFNTWGPLNDNRRSGIIKDVMEDVLKDEAPDFLTKGPFSFHNTDSIKTLLANAGFKSILIEPVKQVVSYTNLDDYLNGFIDGTPLSAFFQTKDPSLRTLIRQNLKDASKQEFGESLQSEMLAFVCVAQKD